MPEKIAAETPRKLADASALPNGAEPAPAEDAAHAPTSAPAAPHPLEAVVDRWFADSFHGSLLARETHVFNLVHDAVQQLKRRLINGAT